MRVKDQIWYSLVKIWDQGVKKKLRLDYTQIWYTWKAELDNNYRVFFGTSKNILSKGRWALIEMQIVDPKKTEKKAESLISFKLGSFINLKRNFNVKLIYFLLGPSLLHVFEHHLVPCFCLSLASSRVCKTKNVDFDFNKFWNWHSNCHKSSKDHLKYQTKI